MIVSLATAEGDVALEESGFEPVSLGEVVSGAIRRRHLTLEQVAARSDLPLARLRDILDGRKPLDRLTARKLQTVFPSTMRLFLNIQRSYDFYKRYGVLRPTSPVRRAIIVRRQRRA